MKYRAVNEFPNLDGSTVPHKKEKRTVQAWPYTTRTTRLSTPHSFYQRINFIKRVSGNLNQNRGCTRLKKNEGSGRSDCVVIVNAQICYCFFHMSFNGV